jgi:hypothetical protein
MREPRLGDIIDDYCVKCKRIMNHAVVSLLNGEPAKVRCRTCHNDHDYRHEQPPPPKVDTRKQALFNEVLAKVVPGNAIGALAPEPFPEDPSEEILSVEETVEESPVEEDLSEEDLPADVPPVQKAKPAAKQKATPKKAKAAPKIAPKAKTKTKATARPKAKSKGRK